MTSLFWFRNDLRLFDNPALAVAVKSTDNLIPLFILDDSVSRPIGSAQRWWLHHSLEKLTEDFKKKGIVLLLMKGNSEEILMDLVREHQVDSIYWNSNYDPSLCLLENKLERYFSSQNVSVHIFHDYLLTEPGLVKNKSGSFYKVFTPYFKTVTASLQPKKLLPIPRSFSQTSKIKVASLSDFDLLPHSPDWSEGFALWRPGERAAQKQLQYFVTNLLEKYDRHRDRPDFLGTSRLSPYLHFGEISVRQVWHAVRSIEIADPSARNGAESFLRQLLWREFSYYLSFHFPQLDKKNFQSKFNYFKWKKNKKKLRAWQMGLTGYPIVDAGMRELWATGYLHNRVRMIVASFLTKDLLIDWREGEKWFWDTLVDADLANNVVGWQWVAGSGADAAPYFRIFNPTLQGKKFDPEGSYVRKWVPELALLPKKYIHNPTAAPEVVLEEAGVILGKDYPEPIVNHKIAREEAMKRYRSL